MGRIRRFLVIVLIASFVGLPWSPATAVITNRYYRAVSATQTNTSINLGFGSMGVRVINDGPASVYMSFTPVAVTTANTDWVIKAGEVITVNTVVSVLSFICATGETATVRVYGLQVQ